MCQGVGGLSELGIAGQGVSDSLDMLSTHDADTPEVLQFISRTGGTTSQPASQPRMFDFVVLDRGVLIEWQGVAGIGGW